MPTPWITFDCFGTLVDWHTGFASILAPCFGIRTPEAMRAYHRFERELEAERPHRLYKDVLSTGLSRAAESLGFALQPNAARSLPEQWGMQPIFPDVEPLLAGLRAAGYRLAVLTNCDEDLFARTQSGFLQPFDLVVTAERVRDYKPSLAHFRTFAQLSRVAPGGWIHVACSWYHDIEPASRMGIPSIWLDRDRTGEDPRLAWAHVRSGAEALALLQQRAEAPR